MEIQGESCLVFEVGFSLAIKLGDGSHCVERSDTTGQYAFSLNVNFFNMEGMTLCGAKASCGMISMACLDSPVTLWYKQENMYLVSIIPGHVEPHLIKGNHNLHPLINKMVECSDPWIRLSRTALHLHGHHAQCALILAAFDVPSAHKAAQLVDHSSHHFCSICNFVNFVNLVWCWHSTHSRSHFQSIWNLLVRTLASTTLGSYPSTYHWSVFFY